MPQYFDLKLLTEILNIYSPENTNVPGLENYKILFLYSSNVRGKHVCESCAGFSRHK